MDIKEIKLKKIQLENTIRDALISFKKETDLYITGINLEILNISTHSGREFLLNAVNLEIRV